jgi:hypothetical protein
MGGEFLPTDNFVVSILRIVHLLEINYVTVMDSTKAFSVHRANPHKEYGIEVKYTEV